MTWLCVFLGAAASPLRPAVQLFLLSFSSWRSIISSLAASIIPYAHPREMEHITTLLCEWRHDDGTTCADLTARSSAFNRSRGPDTLILRVTIVFIARTLSNDDKRKRFRTWGDACIDYLRNLSGASCLMPLRERNTNDAKMTESKTGDEIAIYTTRLARIKR